MATNCNHIPIHVTYYANEMLKRERDRKNKQINKHRNNDKGSDNTENIRIILIPL